MKFYLLSPRIKSSPFLTSNKGLLYANSRYGQDRLSNLTQTSRWTSVVHGNRNKIWNIIFLNVNMQWQKAVDLLESTMQENKVCCQNQMYSVWALFLNNWIIFMEYDGFQFLSSNAFVDHYWCLMSNILIRMQITLFFFKFARTLHD